MIYFIALAIGILLIFLFVNASEQKNIMNI